MAVATNDVMSGALSWEFAIVLRRSANESNSADAKRERIQPTPCNYSLNLNLHTSGAVKISAKCAKLFPTS